jgi:hypothetical protein
MQATVAKRFLVYAARALLDRLTNAIQKSFAEAFWIGKVNGRAGHTDS